MRLQIHISSVWILYLSLTLIVHVSDPIICEQHSSEILTHTVDVGKLETNLEEMTAGPNSEYNCTHHRHHHHEYSSFRSHVLVKYLYHGLIINYRLAT